MKIFFKRLGVSFIYLIAMLLVAPAKIILNEPLRKTPFEMLKMIWTGCKD